MAKRNPTPLPNIGQVWDITHSRKGSFTARLLDNPRATFFGVEVMAGQADFVSEANVQRGKKGDIFQVRASFVTFVQRRPDLEIA